MTVDDAEPRDWTKLFRDSGVATVAAGELKNWALLEEGRPGRLLRPPIQRSLVWTNAQIVNFWDSLLRGFPPGMLLVHRVVGASALGRDAAGETTRANANDWQLFDGQQRLAALLLGFGEGEWKRTRKLWIDLDPASRLAPGQRFLIRISSLGQPFGYRADNPNEKAELSQRQARWTAEPFSCLKRDAQEVFDRVEGPHLIGGNDRTQLLAKLLADSAAAAEIAPAVATAKGAQFVVRELDAAIVGQSESYTTLFQRLGQGGTRLTEDELTYSLIKHDRPLIHDRMAEIVSDPETGRLASEVDLVLAALRVAKVLHPEPNQPAWKITHRPQPAWLEELRTWSGARERFRSLIPDDVPGELKAALVALRRVLEFRAENPDGLPAMLLARMPKELLDVLLLLAVSGPGHRGWSEADKKALRAFALHWLLFVHNSDMAGRLAFEQRRETPTAFDAIADGLPRLVERFVREGKAWRAPSEADLRVVQDHLDRLPSDARARRYEERYAELDGEGGPKTGEALRRLSTDSERLRRALMWTQRAYLAELNYDPTSERDEDLPVDLDHLLPQKNFGWDWDQRTEKLAVGFDHDAFRGPRRTLGDSLGNFRWLSAPDNRARQAGKLVESRADEMIGATQDWNDLISTPRWNPFHIASFQRLIERRTLTIAEILIEALRPVLS